MSKSVNAAFFPPAPLLFIRPDLLWHEPLLFSHVFPVYFHETLTF